MAVMAFAGTGLDPSTADRREADEYIDDRF
jgi:hypothetical protein